MEKKIQVRKTGRKFLDELFGVNSCFGGYIRTKEGSFFFSWIDDEYGIAYSEDSSEYINDRYKKWKEDVNTNEFLEKERIYNIPSINSAREFLSKKVILDEFFMDDRFVFDVDGNNVIFYYKKDSFLNKDLDDQYLVYKRKRKLSGL